MTEPTHEALALVNRCDHRERWYACRDCIAAALTAEAARYEKSRQVLVQTAAREFELRKAAEAEAARVRRERAALREWVRERAKCVRAGYLHDEPREGCDCWACVAYRLSAPPATRRETCQECAQRGEPCPLETSPAPDARSGSEG